MSTTRRLWCRACLCATTLASIALLGACAAPARPPGQARAHWSGRLQLRLDTPEPPKSFTAHFDLQGSPQQGALELSTPLGTLLARLQWEPDKAWLQTPQEQREGTSVDELVQTLLGAPLPLDALFDWLDGVPTTASGWNLELGENQIRAQRHTPTPTVTLRILLTP